MCLIKVFLLIYLSCKMADQTSILSFNFRWPFGVFPILEPSLLDKLRIIMFLDKVRIIIFLSTQMFSVLCAIAPDFFNSSSYHIMHLTITGYQTGFVFRVPSSPLPSVCVLQAQRFLLLFNVCATPNHCKHTGDSYSGNSNNSGHGT